MIIREQEDHFIMIEQHEHARLSGAIAKHLKSDYFVRKDSRGDVIFAIFEHDRGWIRLDASPIWNELEKAPFYFVNYPYAVKLKMYQVGIEEVERVNPYAGYLVSYHFSSFPDIKNGTDLFSITFMQEEQQRQNRLRLKLNLTSEMEIKQHYRLLGLCDDLSLYVCLNEPGVHKEEEHPWFREGLGKLILPSGGDESIQAYWRDERTIDVQPFPFSDSFEAELSYRRVAKKHIQDKGLAQAYYKTVPEVQKIRFN